MTITLPKLRHKTSGMTRKKMGFWQLMWREDGKQRMKSLGTGDVEEAILRRDEERASLMEAGATIKECNDIAVTTDSTHYIYLRKPYEVKLPGRKHLGFFETEEAAKAARNKALNITTP